MNINKQQDVVTSLTMFIYVDIVKKLIHVYIWYNVAKIENTVILTDYID